MRTIEEIERDLNKLQAELQECKATPKYWEPVNREKAWYLGSSSGEIHETSNWGPTDAALITAGLVYPTEEEALKAHELRECTYRLKKAIWELNGGKEYPFVFNRGNCSVQLIEDELASTFLEHTKYYPNWLYTKSCAVARELIELHSKDLRTYLEQ